MFTTIIFYDISVSNTIQCFSYNNNNNNNKTFVALSYNIFLFPYTHGCKLEGCLTVHIRHEIK